MKSKLGDAGVKNGRSPTTNHKNDRCFRPREIGLAEKHIFGTRLAMWFVHIHPSPHQRCCLGHSISKEHTHDRRHNTVDHPDHCLDWCHSILAIQQRMGLLPVRRHWADLADRNHPFCAGQNLKKIRFQLLASCSSDTIQSDVVAQRLPMI